VGADVLRVAELLSRYSVVPEPQMRCYMPQKTAALI